MSRKPIIITNRAALHPLEEDNKYCEIFVDIFARDGNRPLSEVELAREFERVLGPCDFVEHCNGDVKELMHRVRSYITKWNNLCKQHDFGGHQPGKDGCKVKGPHRICTRKNPNGKGGRSLLRWIDKDLGGKLYSRLGGEPIEHHMPEMEPTSVKRRRTSSIREPAPKRQCLNLDLVPKIETKEFVDSPTQFTMSAVPYVPIDVTEKREPLRMPRHIPEKIIVTEPVGPLLPPAGSLAYDPFSDDPLPLVDNTGVYNDLVKETETITEPTELDLDFEWIFNATEGTEIDWLDRLDQM